MALSSDGKTVAIGAWLNDGNSDNAGHVRIFRLKEEHQMHSGELMSVELMSAKDTSTYKINVKKPLRISIN